MGLRNYFSSRRRLVGVDIGSSSVKVALLTFGGKDRPSLEFAGQQDIPVGTLVNGSIQRESLAVQALQKLLTAGQIKGGPTALALPCQTVLLKRISTPHLSDADLRKFLSLEIVQHFPVHLDEINFDYGVLTETCEGKLMEVLVVAAQKEKIASFSRVISSTGLKPVVVDVDALALHNLYLHNIGSEGTTVEGILDIGSHTTNVIVFRGDFLLFNRVLPVGSHKSTMCESLALEIEQALSYCHRTLEAPKVEHLHLCGGGSLIPRLCQSLSLALNLTVDFLNPLENLDSREKNADNTVPQTALAIGLAMRMASPYFSHGCIARRSEAAAGWRE